MSDWRDQLAGHRMEVDRAFADRIRDSDLSNQEWNLVMTAVEFDVEGEGSEARLVADTSRIDAVVSEFGDMAAPATAAPSASESGGGLWEKITGVFGVGSDGTDQKRDLAVELADEYAAELQAHLEEQNRWKSIRRAATQPSPE